MGELLSEIWIMVKNKSDWEKLYDMPIDEDWGLWGRTGRDVFTSYPKTEWYRNGWGVDYFGMSKFIDAVRERLGRENCVILAYGIDDDLGDEAYYEVIYSVCGEMDYKEVRNWDDVDITDPEAWFKWARIKLPLEARKKLVGFGPKFDFAQLKPFRRIPGEDQRHSRLLISVKDPSLWKRLAALDLSDPGYCISKTAQEMFGGLTGNDFVITEGWHLDFEDRQFDYNLSRLTKLIHKTLGKGNCFILADCIDANASQTSRITYTSDRGVQQDEIEPDASLIDITNIPAWLKNAGIKVNDKFKAFMAGFPSQLFDFARPRSATCASNPAAAVAAAPSPIQNQGEHQSCEGCTFVVTGDVYRFANRESLSSYITERGGRMTGSVSKNTNFLINNDAQSNSAKNRRAKELGIPIITEEEFIQQFGGPDE